MTVDAAKALQFETEFLSGVDANLEGAKGKQLRGSMWERSRHDEGDKLRALMASNRNYDRELLKSMPANRRVALHGYEHRLVFWKRRTGVAVASVLSPLSHYAKSPMGEAPPIDLGELADHVRRLVTDPSVPHVIGVCSPTGFTDEARGASLSAPNVTVVLVEPDGEGGWRKTAAGEDVDPLLLKIFDPEGSKQKLERVRGIIDARSVDLLTGGLSVSSVAKASNLPEEVVREGFRQVADGDPELRLAKKGRDSLLFRGAPVRREERQSMNVIDRIKQLFSGEGGDAEKINLLAERRAALAQRRDRIYEDIGKLEKKEAELLEQGRTARSQVPRRRIAAQLAQLRKDIGRQNTTAAMLNQQINIISTDIHNLTLLEQGEMAKLPDTTELTEHAVAAEEMLETLSADAELVGQLETGMEEAMTGEEELAILREFEDADEESAGAKRATAPESAPAAQSAPAAKQKSAERPAPEAPERPAPESAAHEPPSQAAGRDSSGPPAGKEGETRPADPEAT